MDAKENVKSDPLPRIGEWIIDKDDNRGWDRVRYYCSECHDWQTYGRTKFCPHCGARMEVEGK